MCISPTHKRVPTKEWMRSERHLLREKPGAGPVATSWLSSMAGRGKGQPAGSEGSLAAGTRAVAERFESLLVHDGPEKKARDPVKLSEEAAAWTVPEGTKADAGKNGRGRSGTRVEGSRQATSRRQAGRFTLVQQG